MQNFEPNTSVQSNQAYEEWDDINIVVAGGGSGAANLTSGIRQALPHANLTEIVTVTDDGGSTGRLMRQYGTQPVGDLRRGLSALVDDPVVPWLMERRLGPEATSQTVRHLGEAMLGRLDMTGHNFNFDFAEAVVRKSEAIASDQDRLRGHTLGNLILTAAAVEFGSLREASWAVGDVIGARGQVLPVSDVRHKLVLFDAGNMHVGEHIIDELGEQDFIFPLQAEIGFTTDLDATAGNPSLTHVMASGYTLDAVGRADVLVTGSGSRNTSVRPVLEAGGMREAVAGMDGQVVVVPNLVSEAETAGMMVSDFMLDVQRGLGRVDAVIYNTDYETLRKFGLRPVCEERSAWQIGREFGVEAYPRQLVGAGRRHRNPNDEVAGTRSEVLTRADVVGSVIGQIVSSRRQLATV